MVQADIKKAIRRGDLAPLTPAIMRGAMAAYARTVADQIMVVLARVPDSYKRRQFDKFIHDEKDLAAISPAFKNRRTDDAGTARMLSMVMDIVRAEVLDKLV